MLQVELIDARPQMVLAAPVWRPDRPEQALLRPGFRLDDATIQRLQELELRSIWVQGPASARAESYFNHDLLRLRARLYRLAESMFERIQQDQMREVNWAGFERLIEQLARTLVMAPDGALHLELPFYPANRVVRHAAEVCFLSVLLGLKLQGYLVQQRRRIDPRHASNLHALGLGGLLHDIGMYRIDPATWARWQSERNESDPDWRRHVDLGVDLVASSVDRAVAAVIHQHHQHYDGTGFPRLKQWDGRDAGIQGNRIHVFARLVTAADLFDEIKFEAFDRRVPNVVALSHMLESQIARRIDPTVLRAMFTIIPAYPPGTRVTLSDGRHGYAIDWRPNAPCRPTVAIIDDVCDLCHPHARSAPIVDLLTTPQVWIVGSEGAPVEDFNFDLDSHFGARSAPMPLDVLEAA